MIIKIKNFGPIKEFEIDLSKDFSIIYGKNNIGKSYAVSVVYLILKYFIIEKGDNQIPPISRKDVESSNKDIKGKIEFIASHIFRTWFIDKIHKAFDATFGNEVSNKFSNQETEIHINSKLTEIVLYRAKDSFIISKFKILENNRRLNMHDVFLPQDIITDIYIDIRQVGDIYYFPASRIGIYQGLSSFSSIFAELSKSRGSIKKSFEIPSIPEPVSDYFLALSSIKKGVTDPDNPIVLLAKEIEQTVLGGEVIFDDDTKKMIYKPYNTDLYLDMFQVSSMAAEISPLVLFLKYIIAPSHNKKESKSLLFIEEPEAHLHPEIQVKLMEIFAKLVKHNIKIIITSHSNYIFNKMNNLILEKKLDVSNMSAIILEQSEQGSISRVLPTDYLGVEDENFIGVTEQLFNEKIELINDMNKDS